MKYDKFIKVFFQTFFAFIAIIGGGFLAITLFLTIVIWIVIWISNQNANEWTFATKMIVGGGTAIFLISLLAALTEAFAKAGKK